MPVTTHILPSCGLIYVRFAGHAATEETISAFKACARHPDYRPGFRHLVDFSRVTSFVVDYPGLMRIQAVAAGAFRVPQTRPTVFFLAPTPAGQRVAQLVVRSWEGVTSITAVVLANTEQLGDVLGLRDPALDGLLGVSD